MLSLQHTYSEIEEKKTETIDLMQSRIQKIYLGGVVFIFIFIYFRETWIFYKILHQTRKDAVKQTTKFMRPAELQFCIKVIVIIPKILLKQKFELLRQLFSNILFFVETPTIHLRL